ncbi:FAD-dependent oxidoreductase [Rhodovarius crocodyli]|uniref:FAD-dependent oxidoreductase n=1 Tax=Rhodovarius crocodyli TaxID=1979269 RepID=A0A437MLU4_9PROT|nr:FAD-dependent oxidoreductase [Rhodovarius crocodyli]RVT98611.1 FAD-dependent oxidoreductase [Rhodovarius crocodyli]
MAGSVIVLGAGVAGLSAALPLARAGRAVTVIDPLPPAGGASFGNAGLLSPDTVVPIAQPGMLRKVPGWLLDPDGPLVVRPRYLPRAAPWLLRWIMAGRMERVLAVSDAMRALNGQTMRCWQDLLGAADFAALARRTGQVQVWDSEGETEAAARDRMLRARHGIAAEVLDAEGVRALLPGITPAVKRGLFLPGNGHTVSPLRMVRRLADHFLAAGGTLLAERAMKIIPPEGGGEGGGWMVMTNAANHRAATLVVAGGAWSKQMLAPLGIHVPLEAERGYHLMLPDPSVMPALPIMDKARSIAVTPMEEGLRATGLVEIAGLEAPPDEARAARLMGLLAALLPGITGGTPRLWMGSRPSTPDSLPVLGPVKGRPGLHLCFGHGHFGMTGGPPSGRLVSDLILGERPLADPAAYALDRFGA